jgi:dihydroneopterin aldolase
VIVEIHGLEVFGRHGVGEAERRDGQSFLFDVTLELAEPRADAIDATVDYRAVRDAVRELSDAGSYKLL